ncbi:hypothetical protein BDN70DRAFT_936880 [Pholiota conissans]|uniref:F-box domain-containing protein n=1 Tax=Pholiota conissans TaxID=109636 RepID=A0A9P5YS53_9AGAR|nr:hypothetical protein BDN70DRAFT_936880 [Pholiota conissans]
MPFLALPHEIIASILSYLPPEDLLSSQLTSRYLNTAILNSVSIQYDRALTVACANDSPLSQRSTAAKLESLKRVEDAWNSMQTDFTLGMEVPLKESGVYDLTGGVYLLSTADRMGLGYTKLPSKKGEETKWEMMQVGKWIVDVGLCVYEHDLVAIVTSTIRATPAGEPNTYDISIELLELSTKLPHPLARNPSIYVMNSLWERPAVGIEIVGKHLVLVLSFNTREHPEDRVFIFEWQTGTTIASFEARCHTYSSVIFLDEEHFLLPSTHTITLDIFRVPSAPILTKLEPILVLALPTLVQGRILGYMSCRAEPNPIGKDSYPNMRARCSSGPNTTSDSSTSTSNIDTKAASPINLAPERDFLLNSRTALCLFELRIHVLMFHLVPGNGLQMGFPFRFSFTFVAPRKAFLDLIDTHVTRAPEATASEAIPSPPPPTERTHRGGPPSGETIFSFFDDVDRAHERPPMPQHSGASNAHPPHIPKIAYDAWGPPCTRWFGSNEYDVSPRWITTSAGGRCVRMPIPRRPGQVPNEAREDEKARYYVYDFNEGRTRAAWTWKMKKEAEEKERAVTEGRGDSKGKGLDQGGGGHGDDVDGDGDSPRPDKGKQKAADSGSSDPARRTAAAYVPRPRPRRSSLFGFPGLVVSDDEDGHGDEGGVDIDDDGADNQGDADEWKADGRDWKVVFEYEDGTREETTMPGPGRARAAARADEGSQGTDAGPSASASAGGNVALHTSVVEEELEHEEDNMPGLEDVEGEEEWEHDRTMDSFLDYEAAMEAAWDHALHGDGDGDSESGGEDDDEEDDGHGIDFGGGAIGEEHDEDDEHDHHEDNPHPLHQFLPGGDFDGDHIALGPIIDDGEFEDSTREEWSLDPLPRDADALILGDEAILDCPEVFLDPVRHALPCVVRGSRTRHDWQGVLLDEERVIGIMADPMTRHVQNLEVHHFG